MRNEIAVTVERRARRAALALLTGSLLLAVEFMARNHLPAEVLEQGGIFGAGTSLGFGLGFGLGYAVVEDPVMLGGQTIGAVASEGEYWWGGAAGTAFWIDPQQELIAILVIQRMSSPRRLCSELKALVNAAIVD